MPKTVSAPEVDVIIPVFNGARYLAEAVRSAARQTHAPSRIIIADDGSIDETPVLARRLAAEFASVEYLPLQHLGLSATRNAGIRASDAPFVAFLDSDDVWLPEKLEKQFEIFAQADDKVGFVHTAYRNIDETGALLPPAFFVHEPTLRGDVFRALLIEECVITGSASSVAVKRSVLDQAGPFDESLSYAEDRDLWLRLARLSHVDFSPEPLVRIRRHSESKQNKPAPGRELDFFRQLMVILNKWSPELRGEDQYMALQRWRALYAVSNEIALFHTNLTRDKSSISATLFDDQTDLMVGLMTRLRR